MIYDHQTCEQTWSFTIIPLEIGSWNQFLLWNRRQNCTSLISASTQIQGISWRSCRYSQYNHTNPYKLHQFATNWTSEIHWNPLKSIEIWSSLHLTSKPHPKKPWNRRTGARCYQRIAHTAEQDPCGIMGIWPALKTWLCLNKVWSMSNRFLRKSCYPCKMASLGALFWTNPQLNHWTSRKDRPKGWKGLKQYEIPESSPGALCHINVYPTAPFCASGRTSLNRTSPWARQYVWW